MSETCEHIGGYVYIYQAGLPVRGTFIIDLSIHIVVLFDSFRYLPWITGLVALAVAVGVYC